MSNMQGSSAVHLVEEGGKYSSFDKHRQFLPADHLFRQDVKSFTKGVKVTEIAPPIIFLLFIFADSFTIIHCRLLIRNARRGQDEFAERLLQE